MCCGPVERDSVTDVGPSRNGSLVFAVFVCLFFQCSRVQALGDSSGLQSWRGSQSRGEREAAGVSEERAECLPAEAGREKKRNVW